MLDLIKEYAYKRADLLKLEASEKLVKIAGAVTIAVLLLIAVIFFVIMFFLGLGFLIGHYLHNDGFGLLIVSGIFLLFIFITFASRHRIKNFVADKLIKLLED